MRHPSFGASAVGLALLMSAMTAAPAVRAQEPEEEPVTSASVTTLSVEPGQARYTGSDVTSGAPPLTIRTSSSNWEFGFHGYLRAPFRMSFDNHPIRRYVMDADGNPTRDDNDNLILEKTGDREWELNMPNQTPDNSYPTWAYTKLMGNPWAEMIFSYGNSIVVGHVSVAAWSLTDASWRNANTQLGIDRAWVTLNWARAFGAMGGLKLDVGVFGNRYGNAGRYDAGRYDTYLFGRTHVAGETLTANLDIRDNMTLFLEHGFGAKTDVLEGNPQSKFGVTTNPGENTLQWLPYAGEGGFPAFVNHAHAGLLIHTHHLWEELWINAHFMHAFTAKASESDDPDNYVSAEARTHDSRYKDGKYIIGGAEVKFNGAVFGDLYLGFSTMKTDGVARMPDAVEVIHSIGGWDLLRNYYGDLRLRTTDSGDDSRYDMLNPGTGRINTFAWQYTFSLARLVWYLNDKRFWGQGPDLQVSFWGMFNHVNPDDDLEPYLKRWAEKKLKFGGEVFYTPHKYFGLGLRFDHVRPDLDYDEDEVDLNKSTLTSYSPFSVLSPKIRIKTAFITHEELNIQYSRYFWSGGRNEVRAENPHEKQPADRNALMVSVNMWW